MPVNLDALLRYHTINHCLQQSGKKWTWEQLANACADYADEVAYRDTRSIPSKRTIQNDIKIMRSGDLGYFAPIKNEGGCYHYEDPSYSIKNATLNNTDLQSIALACKVLGQYKGFDFFTDLNQIFEKFESHIQVKLKQNIQQYIDFEKDEQAVGAYYLKPVLDAIGSQQTLCIHYQKFHDSETKAHILHPYLLKEYAGRWYVLGWHQQRESIVTLALDRVKNIAASNQNYYQKEFDAESYFAHTIGITFMGGKVEEIVLEVEQEFVPYLLTKPLHATQQIVNQERKSTTFSYQLVVNQELENILMSHINHIKVLLPQSLKQSLLVKIKKSLQNFS